MIESESETGGGGASALKVEDHFMSQGAQAA